jgi:predicted ferric reductase
VGGLAGVVGLALLLLQPLLAAGYLPGIRAIEARRWHRWTGMALVCALFLHIAGLYLTSPPDMIDALLLAAPTVYSIFGVIGLWALVLVVILVAARSRMRLQVATWRILHNTLAVIVVVASVVHAIMIEGAMGNSTKLMLCIGVLAATGVVTVHLRWVRQRR